VRPKERTIRGGLWQVVRAAALVAPAALLFCAAARTQTVPLGTNGSAETTGSIDDESQKDLTKTSIEDLMNMQVTSVSKKEQKVSRTAAAIFIITSEDVRRSGATDIPDLLRMVPGLDVAQINSNTWAINARGLNAQFSNELLVLVDGRNVYTPTFGGVFWDVLDVPLVDIERIEVIRGPGASVWGANAVNGVINIITKKAAETKGGLVVGRGGNIDQGFGVAQYGGSVGNTDYRVYTRLQNLDHYPSADGQDGGDGWDLLQTGFRTDSTLTAKDTVSVEGDMYRGREGDPTNYLPSLTSPAPVPINLSVNLSGGFVQGVWSHAFSSRSDSTVRAEFDTYERDDQLGETRSTGDIEFRHHFAWGDRQDVNWGLEYAHTASGTTGDLFISLDPARRELQAYSAFLQDEIAIVPDRLYLTFGTKLINSFYSGFAVLPTARAAYTLNSHNMVWGAVSHALRTPAALDTSERVNFGGFPGSGGVPVVISQIGNPNMKSEAVIAYELGYRSTVSDNFSVDVATFYNDYYHQETDEPIPTFFENLPAPPHFVMATTNMNYERGESYGVEVAANYKINDRWTLSPGYDFERIHMLSVAPSQDTDSPFEDENSSPHVQAQLRSHVQISQSLSWDTSAYFVGRVVLNEVPSYTRLDSGLSWKWGHELLFSLVGQDLLKDHHWEFVDTTGASRSTEIKRSAYAKVTWQF
jgi:iron complex outermembrane recepter protein